MIRPGEQNLRRFFAVAFYCLICVGIAPLFAATPIPSLQSEVTDTAGLLSGREQEILRQRVADLNSRRDIQLAVLLERSLSGEPIESRALRVAEQWKLGKKGSDRGLVFLLAVQDRDMRLEVGYGLEAEIPDAVAKRILSDRIAPILRTGKFFDAFSTLVSTIEEVLESPGKPLKPHRKGTGLNLPLLFMLLLLLFIALPLQFFLPTSGVRGGQRRYRDDWYGGGGFGGGGGGFGGGGFGGGGFGGGGGGFGGGGASSRW